MTSIQQFIEIRRDGKIIDETMKVEDIFALGATEKVVEIQWRNGSQAVFFRDAYGVSAKVVLGGDFIVANAHDNSGQRRVLLIINADGTQRFQLLNTQLICGVVHHIIPSKKSGDATYIQFTHDDWILMYKEFEEKYAPVASCEKRLIVLGWYHTHPNMPVRMSGIDKSTHVGFFPNEWQFSVIINPQNGTWAVFNGDESKNCNGYIYCTLTEGLESTETILDDNLITSEVTEQINLNQSLAPNGSFVIKRRSTIYQNSIQSSNSIDTRSIDQQSTQRYEINNNLSSRHTITVKYKGGILPYGNTFYYYPLNSDVSIGSKSYLISDALIRQFISYIDNWGFSGEESVAILKIIKNNRIPSLTGLI